MGDPAAQQRETEQIIGVVTGVVQKGADKWQAEVMPDGGSQYAKKLWTKDQSVVMYLSSQIGNRLAFLCNVSHWTNQQNQPVRSLWIDQVGSPTVGSPALAGPPQQPQVAAPPQTPQGQGWNPAAQQPQQSATVQPVATPMVAQAPQPDAREQKIHRQTAAKVAAILLGYLPEGERTLSTLLVVSERLVSYFDNGMPAAETVEDLMNRAMPQGMDDNAAQGVGYSNMPFPGDDDIPF
jgi:hypothetical protein